MENNMQNEINRLKSNLMDRMACVERLRSELEGLREENLALAYENAELKRSGDVPQLAVLVKSTLDAHEMNETLEWLREFFELENLYIAHRMDAWYKIASTGAGYEGNENEIQKSIINAVRTKEAKKTDGTKKEKPENERTAEEKKAHSDLLDAFSYAYSQWVERTHPNKCGGSCKCADKDAEIAELKAEVDSLSKRLRTEKSASEVQRVRLYTEIETLTSENAEMKRKLDTFRHFGMEAI